MAVGPWCLFYHKGLQVGAKGTEFMSCGESVQEFGGSFANIAAPFKDFVLKKQLYSFCAFRIGISPPEGAGAEELIIPLCTQIQSPLL